MLDVTVIEDADAAAVSLDPVRARLLAELAAGPASAAMLAGKVGLPRQKVNYHLKTLERHGLVELAGERRKGNVTERLMRATAASYVISPVALAAVQPDPDRFRDQLSARWLLALGARLVRDVGSLITGATKARKRLATYALDGEVRFASAADRAAFVQELTAGVSALVRKYDAPDAEEGRDHRIVVALHPTVKDQPTPPTPSSRSEQEPVMSQEFEIVREFEVDVPPEQVWEAITHGTGGYLWPMDPPEPREGGKGPFGSTVTAWDPPHRYTNRSEDVGFPVQSLNQLDYTIEPRDEGRRSWVRYVHSGIFTDDWNNQYDGASKHTNFYLHTLCEYLTHFAPRPVTFTQLQGPEGSKTPRALAAAAARSASPTTRRPGRRSPSAVPAGRTSRPCSTTATRTSSGCAPTTPSSASSGAATGAPRSASASTTSRRTPMPGPRGPPGRAGWTECSAALRRPRTARTAATGGSAAPAGRGR